MCVFDIQCNARNNECSCKQFYLQDVQRQYMEMAEHIRRKQFPQMQNNNWSSACNISDFTRVLVKKLVKCLLHFSVLSFLPITLVLISWSIEINFLSQRTPEHKCYGEYGCFSNEAPFNHLPLPWSLEQINISFYLVKKSAGASSGFDLLSSDTLLSLFDDSKDTKIIIHGFKCREHYTSQLRNTVAKQNKWNVIFVDWYGGADLSVHQYPTAASNSRLVAAVTARWLEMLQDMILYPSDRVHCVGISLGAHVCGFVGKHLATRGLTLKRITGLDPAGPYFNDQPVSGRLDASDAQFVDVIHTDVNNAWYWFNMGLQQPVGHVDFYPNGGRRQTSCPTAMDIWNIPFSYWLGCSHMRALELYAASLNPNCTFPASPCATIEDSLYENCEVAPQQIVQNHQLLGEDAIKYSGRGIFHVQIDSWPQHCSK